MTDLFNYTPPAHRDNAADAHKRLSEHGAQALSDMELLTIVAGEEAAPLILAEAQNLYQLSRWPAARIAQVRGVTPRKAGLLVAGFELTRRATNDSRTQPILNRAELAAQFLQPIIGDLEHEAFVVCSLNRRNRLIKYTVITNGTANATLADPRTVFRQTILDGASAVLLAHSHPSGDPSPSAADIALTRLLRQASTTVDIPLLDHVVIGRRQHDPLGRGYFSFREAGLL